MSTQGNPQQNKGTPPPGDVDGPRACGEFEVAPTLDLLNLVFHHPERPNIGAGYFHVYCEANRENMRIIKVGAKVVAHSGIFYSDVRCPRGWLKVGGISCVACHPDYRRCGYGTAVVEDCARKMRADGAHVGLLETGIADWYRRMDWEYGGSQFTYQLDSGNVPVLPELRYDIERGMKGDVEEILALYGAHGLGARRDPKLFEALASRPGTELYTARQSGSAVAYLLVSGGRATEYGGKPAAVAGLMREAFNVRREQAGPTSQERTLLSVSTPAIQSGLPALLDGLGLPRSRSYLGMMKVLDPEGLLRQLGLGGLEVEERKETVRLADGNQSVELSRRELVKLIFGPEKVSTFGSQYFPAPFYQWALDRV